MRSPLAALLSLFVSIAAAADPQLVKDIRLDGVQSSLPRNFVSDGTTAYFVADDVNPSALWKTDGTPEGTRLLKMTMPPRFESFAYSQPWLTISGNTLFFFAANEHALNIQLWRTDGTDEGTLPLAIIGDRFNDQVMNAVAVGPGRLAFLVDQTLWISDGTAAGTHAVTGAAFAFGLVGDGTVAYLTADSGSTRSLWRTDGTAAGTRSLLALGSAALNSVVAGKPFLSASIPGGGADFFVFNGGTELTKVGHVDQGSVTTSFPRGGELLFTTSSSESPATRLWTTNGTAAGTMAIAELPNEAGRGGSAGGVASFVVSLPSGVKQLWRSDGTQQGTFVLTEDATSIVPLARGRQLQYFYEASTPNHGLWMTDGTVAGTRRVSTVTARFPAATGFATTIGDDTLLFAGTDDVQVELWRSGGTADSTRMLRNIADDSSSNPGTLPAGFADGGSQLFFSAFDTEHGTELWRTDGTTAGTSLVRDIRPGTGSSAPDRPVSIGNGAALFSADDGVHGRELWRTDGTLEGTRQVREINPEGDAFPAFLPLDYRAPIVVLDGVAYFRVTGGAARGLWRSDGTDGGTFLLKAGGSDPTIYGSSIVFSTPAGMWKTDGTLAGTTQLMLTTHGRPTAVGSKLFVLTGGLSVLDSLTAAPRVLKSTGDSTSEGTFAVALNGLFLFTVGETGYDRELWRSDGTVDGTRILRDIRPGAKGSIAPGTTQPFAILGSTFYFTADDGVHGAELWSTDGTEAGTRMVADLAPGATDSWPDDFAVGDGKLWFSAFDPDHGRELWSLQGTGFTRYDISPGPASSGAGSMAPWGGAMWFHASTPATGSELWKIQTSAPPRRRTAGR